MSVEKNLENVRSKIHAACLRSGRKPSEVRLIAVSKGHPLEKIEAAFNAQQKLFGENYLQEALPKTAAFPKAEWHFIGALQSNKVKQVVGTFECIHSVDRESVLLEISKRAVEKKIEQKILLEINLGDEASKSGMDWKTASGLIKTARELPGVLLSGLMGMPPLHSAEASRPFFRQLKEFLNNHSDENLRELSMGTSQDYEVAIEEGATLVRIGTEIFGKRSQR